MHRCWSEPHRGANSSPRHWRSAQEATTGTREMGRNPLPVAWTTWCTSWPSSGRSSLRLFRQRVRGGVYLFLTREFNTLFASFADIAGGYLCFVISILMIGVVTAIIGDVASHFGCTLGIKDSVTAIVFVALGTSIPGEDHLPLISLIFNWSRSLFPSPSDTFASKVAAIQDKYADASVGNVTGSNAVNVFLGIGVAWTIAAIYHACNGEDFVVDPGKWVEFFFFLVMILNWSSEFLPVWLSPWPSSVPRQCSRSSCWWWGEVKVWAANWEVRWDSST